MDIEKLQRLGLNFSEAKIYLVLLELGKSQVGEISKKTQINRTTTYDSLERLIEKGIVIFVIEANKKVFSPVSPKIFLEDIKEKKKAIEEILSELNLIFKESKGKEESNIYRGRKGIKSILQDILNYKEYIAFGSSGRFLEVMKYDFVNFQKQKKFKKIKSRVILSESSKKSESVKIANSEFRFTPDKFTSPTTTFVYGENTAIIIWSEVPIATLIKSKQVSKSYRNYFELLWKQ